MNTNHLVQLSESGLRLLLVPSAKAAVLAVIALGLTWALRKWMAPRWRHLLWMLVFARLLLPDVGAWKWSAHQWSRGVGMEAMPNVVAAIRGSQVDEGMASEEHQAPVMVEAHSVNAAVSSVEAVVNSEVTSLAMPRMTWWEVVGIVWACGVLVMLGAMVVCSLRFQRRVLGVAVPAGEVWTEELEKLRGRCGWNRVPKILVSSRLSSPVLTGLLRPRIVLPLMVSLDALTARQRRHLLLHEMAHARRGDLWLQTGASLLLAVQWFNPLLWVAHRRLRVEAEACADAWVVRHEDEADARNYGGTLVQMVAQSASLMALIFVPGVLGMAGGGSELRERLTELALGQRRKRFWTLGALGVVMLTVAATFTRPLVAEVAAKIETSTKAELQAKPGVEAGVIRGITVDMEGKPVAGVRVTLRPGDEFSSTPYSSGNEEVSDQAGHFQFEKLIKNQTLRLSYTHPDYAYSDMVPATVGSGMEMKLVLRPGMKISGTVTDASDGKPVPKVRVYVGPFPVRQYNNWSANKYVWTDDNGHYVVEQRNLRALPALIRVESNRHATYVSEPIDASRVSKPQDVVLQPRKTMEGTVVDADSLPVAGALVWVAEGFFSQSQEIDQKWLDRIMKTGENGILNRGLTKDGGAFKLKIVDQELTTGAYIVAMTPEAMGRVSLEEFLEKKTVTLLKWSTLKVKVVDAGGKPQAGMKISLESQARSAPYHSELNLKRYLSGTTDAEGRVTFQQVLPESRAKMYCGDLTSAKEVLVGSGETQEQTFTTVPSAIRFAKVEGMREVSGQVVAPAELGFALKGASVMLVGAELRGPRKTALCSEEGHFVVSEVPPGRYVLTAKLPDPEKVHDFEGIANAGVEFAFEADLTKSVFEVGKLVLKKVDTSLLPRLSQETLALPQGPVAMVKVKLEDVNGKAVGGADVNGYLVTAKQRGGYDLEGLIKTAPTQSNAEGEATATFQRDVPGSDPMAGVQLSVEHPDYLVYRPSALADGAAPTLKLQARPMLQVSGPAKMSDLWASVGSFPGMPVELKAVADGEGEGFRGGVNSKGLMPYLVVDQSDPKHWRFSELSSAEFEEGKVLKVTPRFSPGVVIEGKLTGLTGPLKLHAAWACAEVMLDVPVAPETTRPVSSLLGLASRPLLQMRWVACAPVEVDGSFYFPGVPHGKLNLQVVGPGWLMDEEPEAGGLYRGRELTAKDEVLRVNRGIRPTLKARLLVQAPNGSPAAGARVQFSRTLSRSQIALSMRTALKPTVHVGKEHRAALLEWMQGKIEGHRVRTGADGIATLENLPEGLEDLWVSWEDPKTKAIHRRTVSLTVSAEMADPAVVSVGPETVAELEARMTAPGR